METLTRQGGKRAAVCRCSCGIEATVLVYGLVDGRTRSCGCLKRETAAANGRSTSTHGKRRHSLYGTWRQMHQRCSNTEHVGFTNYGGRGVKVCAEWRDAAAFIDYVEKHLGPKPAGFTLDRIDNDKGYEPGNVQWASPGEQQRNSRRARIITHNGRTMNLVDWANEAGLPFSLVSNRLRAGWTMERAIDPTRRNRWSL